MATIPAETIRILRSTWDQPRTFIGWLTTVDHRSIGLRYIVTGMVFFVLAGIAALLMRIQLAVPENTFLNAELYNQIFTMHGTAMMFLFAVPIMQGIGIYFVPLMIGARDVAFPRANAFGFWVFLFAGVILWLALFFGEAPDGGWFNYVPLSHSRYSPGLGIDLWATMITFLEASALIAAVQIIVTTMLMRAPGMSINRIPLFVWAELVTAFMVIFAMPTLMVASMTLELDRRIATHFYNPAAGGDPLLWQHLFWFFGHPEVYIIFIPAAGIVTALVATFSRRPLVGYIPMVLSFVATGFIGFGVWVHHMFATGLSPLGMSFFSVASFMIAIPSAVQIFATLATFYYGRLWFKVPLLYVFGFLFNFILGGITGVMIASIPLDWQVHDTYFLVAHFHYVLIGGAVFPLLGGLYYWFPKLSGRMLNDRLGLWSFWLIFIGFNVTFFPMHLTGFYGMSRRLYTYLAGLGWEGLNMTSSIGAFVLALGVLLFIINVFNSLGRGEPAPDNPWGAGTLEWATTSPPQPYSFRVAPAARSRYALWHEKAVDSRDQERLTTEERYGLLPGRRETLGTSILDAVPQQRVVLANPSIMPILTAVVVGFTFLGLAFDIILVPIGLLLLFVMLVIWHKPSPEGWNMGYVKAGPPGALPTSMVASHFGIKPPVWWGMFWLIVIEAVAFGALISVYFYLRSGVVEWPIGTVDPPELLLPTINAFILWATFIPIYLSKSAIKKGNQSGLKIALIAIFLMNLIFVILKVIEYTGQEYNWATNAYTSVVWVITGFHVLHVLSVVLKTGVIGYYAFRGYFNEERYDGISTNALYAYFVAAIWVPLYFVIYLAPYIF